MTNIEILQIIIALLIVLGLKYFYSKVNKKIDVDIEKEKEKEKEKEREEKQKKADKENYWLIKYQRELKETLDAIETRIIQTNGNRHDINQKFDCYYNKIFELAKKLSHFLDKNDKFGSEFECFEVLLRCYYFKKPSLEKEIKGLEKDCEDLRLYYKEKNEELEQEKQKLQMKQQELELREARIVKIESAQKILNSELVEKINKEID